MHDRGLTTTIDWRNKDAKGHSVSSDKHGQIHRLRVWQERIRTKTPANEISSTRLGDRSNGQRTRRPQPSQGDRERHLPTGARSGSHPRPIDRRRRDQRALHRLPKGGYPAEPRGGDGSFTRRPAGDRPHLPIHRGRTRHQPRADEPETVRPAILFGTRRRQGRRDEGDRDHRPHDRTGLHSGKSPTGFAAAAIYAAGLLCEETIPQRAVADTAQTTVVTVRNRYREQLEAIDQTPAT